MNPTTKKLATFEHFLNNMKETEKKLRANIEDCQDLIRNRKISIKSDCETMAFARNKLENITDSKEIAKFKGHIADLGMRIEASQSVLENTEKILAQYEADLTDSKLETLARDAVDEQYLDIIKYQKLFHEVLQNVEVAKNNYLKAIIRIGEIRNAGNWAIERMKKAVPHAKVVSPSYAEFETSLNNLGVDLEAIKVAFYRLSIK